MKLEIIFAPSIVKKKRFKPFQFEALVDVVNSFSGYFMMCPRSNIFYVSFIPLHIIYISTYKSLVWQSFFLLSNFSSSIPFWKNIKKKIMCGIDFRREKKSQKPHFYHNIKIIYIKLITERGCMRYFYAFSCQFLIL